MIDLFASYVTDLDRDPLQWYFANIDIKIIAIILLAKNCLCVTQEANQNNQSMSYLYDLPWRICGGV